MCVFSKLTFAQCLVVLQGLLWNEALYESPELGWRMHANQNPQKTSSQK